MVKKMTDAKLVIISIISLAVVGAFVFLSLGVEEPPVILSDIPELNDIPIVIPTDQDGIKKFNSIEELQLFLEKSSNETYLGFFGYYGGFSGGIMEEFAVPVMARDAVVAEREGRMFFDESFSLAQSSPQAAKLTAAEYSTTNIQVKNVDEPDFVKNDGKYLYILMDNNLTIIDAFPPEDAQTILDLKLDIPYQNNVQNLFLNGDRLVVLYNDIIHKATMPDEFKRSMALQSSSTVALLLDVTNRELPKVLKEYSVDGYYHDARMIDNFVYLITKEGIDYRYPVIPEIRESDDIIQSPDIWYFDDMERPSTFTTVAAFDLFGDDINSETYLLGSSDTIYVSENAIYLTFQKYYPSPAYFFESFYEYGLLDGLVDPLPTRTQDQIQELVDDSEISDSTKWNEISEILTDSYSTLSHDETYQIMSKITEDSYEFSDRMALESQRTVIYKIDIDGDQFDYSASNQVLGHLLNQFSMDEHDDRFRVATTVQFWGHFQSFMHNNVYIFDENLDLVGSLEGVAPDESIYSARFMGDDLYLVTFRQVDPFFVIDLSGNNPKILGELKIPGFSNYLQPYGEDHVIGIGRDADLNGRQEGIKIALFDVSDFNHPRMTDEVIIGDSGTWSAALNDHKAILIDENKSIISIPINGGHNVIRPMEIEEELYPYYAVWNGFYVYGIDTDKGFDFMGKIRHDDSSNQMLSRSLYIEDALYTISESIVKINDLNNIANEINSIGL